jgi:hypothetical protein
VLNLFIRGEAFIHTSTNSRNPGAESMGSMDKSMDAEAEVDDEPSHLTPTHVEKRKELIISQALRQGESYGVRALFEQYVFSSTLSSGACVSEILFLSRSSYRRTCRVQLNDEDYAASTLYTENALAAVKSQRTLKSVSGLSRAISAKHTQMMAGTICCTL